MQAILRPRKPEAAKASGFPSSAARRFQDLIKYESAISPVRFWYTSLESLAARPYSGFTDLFLVHGLLQVSPPHGHMAGSVVERHSRNPEVGRFDHDDTSAVSRAPGTG